MYWHHSPLMRESTTQTHRAKTPNVVLWRGSRIHTSGHMSVPGLTYERHIPACDLKTLASSLLTSPILKRCLDASDKKHNRAHICIITLRNNQPPRQAHLMSVRRYSYNISVLTPKHIRHTIHTWTVCIIQKIKGSDGERSSSQVGNLWQGYSNNINAF
jgi:hypothetical protein